MNDIKRVVINLVAILESVRYVRIQLSFKILKRKETNALCKCLLLFERRYLRESNSFIWSKRIDIEVPPSEFKKMNRS